MFNCSTNCLCPVRIAANGNTCKNKCDTVSIILVQDFSPVDSVLNDLNNSSDRTQPLPIIAEDLEI